jgi:hypothetical protein
MSNIDARSRSDYQSARTKALFRKVLNFISGQKRDLLEFDKVRAHLRLGGPVYRGLQYVPVSKIVGTVNRYHDFDRMFLPMQSHTARRWQRISSAWYRDVNLPPILLYKVGEIYFVIDGNHRVSVARNRGQEYIDAEVRECASKVPVTEDIHPEDLELLGSQVEFIERTQVDKVLPGVKIETTLLGGYDRLIEHIAVHRYYLGLEENRLISETEAVLQWYENLYQPVVKIVEDSDILEDFPNRTSADLYLWIMDHLHFLKHQPGFEDAEPEDAAVDFLNRLDGDIDAE